MLSKPFSNSLLCLARLICRCKENLPLNSTATSTVTLQRAFSTELARVEIESGTLEGLKCRNDEDQGKEYYSFQGIPYAKPPIGELRFKPPQPVQPWRGIRNATKDGPQCYSRNAVNPKEKLGSEDCLYLNVFTPNIPDVKTTLKPVMVFIHGGAFIIGSNSKSVFGPEFLIRDDVVLVTINYRLGFLGFLKLDDPSLDVPGNAGHKDMIEALRWVQRNIEQFGGDPKNVTVFGESAGACSVHLLMLSPLAKGLFHKGIAQSATGLTTWGRNGKKLPKLQKLLGIEGNDQRKLFDKLSTMPVESLHALQEKLRDGWNMMVTRPAGFSVETKDQKGEPFLTEEPEELIAKGQYHQVPLMLGFTSREGMLIDIFMKLPIQKLLENKENVVPINLGLQIGSDVSKEVADKILKFYYGDRNPVEADVDLTYKLYSDNFFIRDIYRTAVLHLETTQKPIYLYEMTLETSRNIQKKLAGIKTPGVCHADDLLYLFRTSGLPPSKPNSPEDVGVRRFCKLWTNFAKYGNPTPEPNDLLPTIWKPFDRDESYLDIGLELTMKTRPAAERMKFWQEIFTYRNLKN